MKAELVPQLPHSGHIVRYALVVDGEDMGRVEICDRRDFTHAVIYDVLIAEDRRRQGHGHRLMECVVRKLEGRAIRLSVLRANHVARRLYEAHGFAYIHKDWTYPSRVWYERPAQIKAEAA